MILYHGSNMEITSPDLSHSKPFKDFGKGFYLSRDYEQALLSVRLQTMVSPINYVDFKWESFLWIN